MAKTDTPAIRAPRGTKILAKAFLSAADNIPEAQRDTVIKAALSLIREELKAAKDKVKAASALQKARTAKAPVARKVGRPRIFKSEPIVADTPKKVAKKAGKKIAAPKPELEKETQQAAE